MRVVRGFVRLCAAIAGLTLLASYLGHFLPLGDSLAVFRVWLAYGLAGIGVVAVLLRVGAVGLVSVVVAGAALVHLGTFNGFETPAPQSPDIVVYTKNLGAGRVDWLALGPDIAAVGADVVLLQEVTRQTVAALPQLLPDHPHQHVCRFPGSSAMVVASRWPLDQTGCTDIRSLAYARTGTPVGTIWLASIHQSWPFPYDQPARLDGILEAIGTARGRRVIAGDFNMVPWGSTVLRIVEASGTERISPVEPTIEVRGVGLPIDHVLTDGWGDVTLRPRFGSDHLGLVSRIAWR